MSKPEALVLPTISDPRPAFGAPRPSAADRVGSSVIRELLELVDRPEIISLAGGMPAADLFPTAAIAEAAAEVLADGTAALQYGPTGGYAPLVEWIAADRGATPDQVLVTHGSQQALDLIARAVLAPGDVVALADPAYVGALQIFRLDDAVVAPVPTDRDGLDVDALAALLEQGLRPRLVYVVASFHNPTGATMPAARRRRLVDLATRYDFLIVDDDPYGELRWRGEAPPALAALAAEQGAADRVMTVGTFSKVLAPGLRVGYLVGPAALVRQLVIVKQAADLQTSSLSQRIVHHVVADDVFLAAHLTALRAGYRCRAEALTAALRRHLDGALTFAAPDGGMFVWARLLGSANDEPTADDLLPHALAEGVAFVVGSAFAVDRRPGPELRLSFATASPVELDEAVARLARALARVRARPAGAGAPR